MHFVIDADSIAYRAAAAAEKRKYEVVHNGEVVAEYQYKKDAKDYITARGLDNAELVFSKIPEDESHALYNVDSLVTGIIENEQCSSYELWVSGDLSYRKYLATFIPYKGNRDSNDKPIHLKACISRLITIWGADIADWVEADDMVAIQHTKYLNAGDASVIVTIDKDLNMVPGYHLNWVTGTWEVITDDEAIRNFYIQLLTGDTTDNIIGIYGIGPVTARKLLADLDEFAMYKVVESEYIKMYGEAYSTRLLENGRLLWMQRKYNDIWYPPNG